MKRAVFDNGDIGLNLRKSKTHVVAAGKEIAQAAQGAFRFCRAYAEQSAAPAARTQITTFFTKALATVDHFGKVLIKSSMVSRAAQYVATPLFTAMAEEMLLSAIARQRSSKPSVNGGALTPEGTGPLPVSREAREESAS